MKPTTPLLSKSILGLILTSLMIASPATLFGADIESSKAVWENAGWKLAKSSVEMERTRVDLVTDSGDSITIVFEKALDDEKFATIARLNSQFKSWSAMKVSDIHFLLSNGAIEIVVIPASYQFENTDLMPYLTSGMYFSYSDNLYYNFRIAVNDVFVGIKGLYLDENRFSTKLRAAIANPREYINQRDPEFLNDRLEMLEAELYRTRLSIIAQHRGGKAMETVVLEAILKEKKEHPEFDSKAIVASLKEKNIKVSQSDVKLVISVFLNESIK